MTTQKIWSGDHIIDYTESGEGKNVGKGSCQLIKNQFKYPLKNENLSIKDVKNDKILETYYKEPKSILFHAKNCGLEDSKDRGKGHDNYFELDPNFVTYYSTICKDEDCKVQKLTGDDILQNNLDVSDYTPDMDSYYTVLNTNDNVPIFDIYGNYVMNQCGDDKYGCSIDKQNTVFNTIKTIGKKLLAWGPFSMNYKYNDTTNEKVKVSLPDGDGDRGTGNNIYIDNRYQGLDKNPIYFMNQRGSSDNKISDGNNSVNSILLPPHVFVDMFEESVYNTNYGQNLPDKITEPGEDYLNYVNGDKFNNINKEKNGWKPGAIRISTNDINLNNSLNNNTNTSFNKNIHFNPYLAGRSLQDLDEVQNYGFDEKKVTQTFGDNNNNKSFIVTDYIDDINNKDELKDYSKNNHVFQPYKPKSILVGRKMPWIAFLRDCALGKNGFDESVCKNYTNYKYFKNLPKEKTDADKFMEDYCLLLNDDKIKRADINRLNQATKDIEDGKRDTKSGYELYKGQWLYDKDNKVCSCVRLGNSTKPACLYSDACMGSPLQYVPYEKRTDACNIIIQNCTGTLENQGEGNINANTIKVYTECTAGAVKDSGICSNDSECPNKDEQCVNGKCINKNNSSNNNVPIQANDSTVLLLIIILIVVIALIISFVSYSVYQNRKNNMG